MLRPHRRPHPSSGELSWARTAEHIRAPRELARALPSPARAGMRADARRIEPAAGRVATLDARPPPRRRRPPSGSREGHPPRTARLPSAPPTGSPRSPEALPWRGRGAGGEREPPPPPPKKKTLPRSLNPKRRERIRFRRRGEGLGYRVNPKP